MVMDNDLDRSEATVGAVCPLDQSAFDFDNDDRRLGCRLGLDLINRLDHGLESLLDRCFLSRDVLGQIVGQTGDDSSELVAIIGLIVFYCSSD